MSVLNTEIIMRQDGKVFKREFIDTELTLNEGSFTKTLPTPVVILKDVTRTGVSVGVSNTATYVFREVSELNISSNYTLNEDGTSSIEYQGLEGIRTARKYKVPKSISLFIGLNYTFNTVGRPCNASVFLFGITNDGRIGLPPLPNIYDTGKVCMGVDWSVNLNDSIDDAIDKVTDWMDTTVWNTDLMPANIELSKSLVMWDEQGEQIMNDDVEDATVDYLKTERPASSVIINGLANAIINLHKEGGEL